MYVQSRRTNPVLSALRYAAWRSGEGLASALSRLRGFAVPDEPLHPYAQNLPMLLGLYERETVRSFRQLVRPGMTVVDGGAHVGYLTRVFSRLVGPLGRVIAVEANPATAALLQSNVRGLGNVTVAAVGLGAEDGELPLYSGPLASGASLVAKPGMRQVGSVPVLSLPSLLTRHGLRRADFLKLDVEGFEPDVLRGAAPLLGQLRPFSCMIEVKRYILEARGTSSEAVLLDLLALGFTARIIGGAPLLAPSLQRRRPDLGKANVLLEMA